MKSALGLDERDPTCFLHTCSIVMVLRKVRVPRREPLLPAPPLERPPSATSYPGLPLEGSWSPLGHIFSLPSVVLSTVSGMPLHLQGPD